MLGKYEIEIYNSRVHYFLTVKRNITILQGNSATGKTELIRLIMDYEVNGASSGITLQCQVRCTVLTSVDWELRLRAMRGNIVFIDETAVFLKTKRFAEMVKGSDNYFVIVSRDDLNQLPYSVDEIYGLRNVSNKQKYKAYHRVYNEMHKLYNLDVSRAFNPEMVITEDSNSGYEFFNLIYSVDCMSAHGKSNLYDLIRNNKDKRLLAIVDAAAFGCEIGKVLRYLETSRAKCVIYAPESFEYLILSANVIDVPETVLKETYKYADSVQYMSWEEFYTAYLADRTRNTISQYGKSRLADYYKTEGTVSKIAAVMPDKIRGF